MRTIIAATLAVALSGGAACAQSGYAISPFPDRPGNAPTFYSGQMNGGPLSGTSQRLGDTTFSTFQNGGRTTTCTSNRIGDFVFTNCN